MDLSNLTLPELSQLENDVKLQIINRGKHDLAQAQEQVKLIANNLGMSVPELFSSMGKSKVGKVSGKPVAPKYQNPNNPDEKWTGRGRKPVWVKTAEESGVSLTSMAI